MITNSQPPSAQSWLPLEWKDIYRELIYSRAPSDLRHRQVGTGGESILVSVVSVAERKKGLLCVYVCVCIVVLYITCRQCVWAGVRVCILAALYLSEVQPASVCVSWCSCNYALSVCVCGGDVPADSEGAAVRETGWEKRSSGGVKRNNVGALGGTGVAASKPCCSACTHTLQLTLVRRNQQIQGLLGEVGPDCHHLFSQLCVHLVLVNTT